MNTAVTLAIKRIIYKLASDPEGTMKKIGVSAAIILGIVIFILTIPTIIISSIPLILFQSNNVELEKKEVEVRSYCMEAPSILYLKQSEWIELERKRYAWCDEIRVTHDFNLDWRQLIVIAAIEWQQDYKDVTKDKIIELGQYFEKRESRVDKVKVTTIEEVDGEKVEKTVIKNIATISVTTKTLEEVLEVLGFEESDVELANYMWKCLETDFNSSYTGSINGGQIYDKGSADIPYFNQGDARWGNLLYGTTDTIKVAGCGPTALSMVIAGLTGREDIDPSVIAQWSVDNGHRCEGSGSYWSLMTDGGKAFGLNVSTVSRQDKNSVVKALSEGKPVIVSMGPGHFTSSGHFIVLTGVDENGMVTVNDPASYNKSQKTWDINLIMSESSTNGGTNGSPFWVFS